MDSASFIHQIASSTTVRPDGTHTTSTEPAVWTLAHKGYSGDGRLHIWVYPSENAAMRAGAEAAIEYGLDEDPTATTMLAAGDYAGIMKLYEAADPDNLLLRVQPAFLQFG